MICWQASDRRVLHRCVFLDRDGVINEKIPGGYVTRWEQFRWRRDAIVGLSLLQAAHFPLIIVSNQACVGKGMLDEAGLVGIMESMRWSLCSHGIHLTAWYCCPHAPDVICSCRKPGTAMLQAAARDFGLDLGECHLLGDSLSDMEAARAAGCKAHFVDPALDDSLSAAVLGIVGDLRVSTAVHP